MKNYLIVACLMILPTHSLAGVAIENKNYALPDVENPGTGLLCVNKESIETLLDALDVYFQIYTITGMPPPGCAVFDTLYRFSGNEVLEYLYISDEDRAYGIIKDVAPTSNGDMTVYAYISAERLVKIGEEGEPT